MLGDVFTLESSSQMLLHDRYELGNCDWLPQNFRQRDHFAIGDSAWINQIEIPEICADIKSKSVQRSPPSNTNTDGCNLSFGGLNSRKAFSLEGLDLDIGKCLH